MVFRQSGRWFFMFYTETHSTTQHDTAQHLKDPDPCHLTCKDHATSDFIDLAAALTP